MSQDFRLLRLVVENQLANSDLTALAILNKMGPNLTQAEKHYVASVARGESFYGNGWKKPGEGLGSNNWGAITTSNTDPTTSFPHIDHTESGKEIIQRYKIYSSPEAGAADLIRVLLKDNVKKAINTGNGDNAVAEQKANRYFTAKAAAYKEMVRRNYEQFLKQTGEARLLTFTTGIDGYNGLVSHPEDATDNKNLGGWIFILGVTGFIFVNTLRIKSGVGVLKAIKARKTKRS